MSTLTIIAKQHMKITEQEIQLDALKEQLKSKLYNSFMKKLGETTENKRLIKENKRLRLHIKYLKEIIKEAR